MIVKPYGPIIQNGWVVDDIDAGIEYWTRRMQVGPFFKFPEIIFETGHYRGRSMIPKYDAAIAYSGDFMIELIKPQGPSIFAEFAEAGRTGVQHMCAMADDMKAAADDIFAHGGVAVQGGTLPDGSSITYFDMGGSDDLILEIACLSPAARGLFAMIKAAAADWDGESRIFSL